jgi:hypothetical protein
MDASVFDWASARTRPKAHACAPPEVAAGCAILHNAKSHKVVSSPMREIPHLLMQALDDE